ncbi:phosphate/phosphite/phosphonate ABC transporter substrate-binding protein [soil metagenome]
MTHHRRIATVVTILVTLVAAGCADDGQQEISSDSEGGNGATESREDWPDTFVLGVIPSEESSELQERYQPLVDMLESELGLAIELFEATDYAGIIEAMISGNVDLAQFGPFSYVIAKSNGANIDAVASTVEDPEEEPGYHSFGIVPPGSDIHSIEDFAGKTVCFVDPSSTSGFLFPSAGLLDAGIDPEGDIQSVFAGGHDVSALSVSKGDCEAGFADDTRVGQQLDTEPGSVEVVWESDLIPGSPLAVRLDLPESLVANVRRIVLEEANVDAMEAAGRCEAGDCIIQREDTWGYVAVDDAFYDPVRAVCEATRAAACEGED